MRHASACAALCRNRLRNCRPTTTHQLTAFLQPEKENDMNRRFVAFVIAMALFPAGALADAVHGHGKKDSAVGRPGDPKNISMTIKVEMSDAMRFTPARITARRGQTIKFVVTNTGKVRHEMVLGTAGELKAHAALMRKFPEMEHADRNQITVEAGKTGEIVWQFTRGGTFDFACLEPGHFEAGMAGKVVVAQ
jgi:uncharacterized cupredoxin-like copper-binding protein